MASPIGNIVFGATVAIAIAVVLIVPAIGGVSTWKYVLAAVGLALIIRAGRHKR